jgi:hypothetical protein
MDYAIAPRDERTQPERVVPGYPQTPLRNPAQPLVRRPLTLSELTGPTAGARGPAGARATRFAPCVPCCWRARRRPAVTFSI